MFIFEFIKGVGLGLQYEDFEEGTCWMVEILIFRFIYFPPEF